jgi:hypothetical protein
LWITRAEISPGFSPAQPVDAISAGELPFPGTGATVIHSDFHRPCTS